jgi:S1-C subfamily serine protease
MRRAFNVFHLEILILRIVHQLLLSTLGLFIAGCASTDVALESRDINVEQNAEPATAISTAAETSLVRQVGPTYVTLTVSAITEANLSNPRASSKSAITSGSGFVVDGAGYVMTAAHVGVKSGNVVSARAANGRIYSGKVVSIMPENDMALIKLRSYVGPAVTPVSNACLTKGATVFSMGKPHAQGDTARFGVLETMSFGQPVRYGAFGYPDAMVMRMSTQKGESGGPLFNDQGKLAGMVVSTLSDGNGQSLNLAHAVPAARLAEFLCANSQCANGWSGLSQQSRTRCN